MSAQPKGKPFMTATESYWNAPRTSTIDDTNPPNYRYNPNYEPSTPLVIFFMDIFDTQKEELEHALPEYSFVRCIGEGAYGRVFLLQKKETAEQFAVKRISCFGLSQYQLANALNEVRLLASLDHPNIVKFYSGLFDKEHEHLYIFLEYANGGDLAQLIEQARERKKRVSQPTVWRVLLNVAEAVEYLHSHEVAHRDIKPANIFRDKQTGFKLGDLNVSKVLPKGSMTRTRAGAPFYISPEVWNHQEDGYGAKCDIWSLGVVIYELCCLKVPFEVDSPEEMTQVLKSVQKKSLPKNYSAALRSLVQGMLQIDPKKRVAADKIIQICRKNLHMCSQRTIKEADVLMQTIVVPQTNERWVNLVHLVNRKTKDKSISSRKSSETCSRKSQVFSNAIKSKNLLPVPEMMRRTSKTSHGGSSNNSKEKQIRLPSLRKYSIQADFENLSSLIEKKSDSKLSESHQEHSGFRGSRIRRNMVCEYIKQVREDLLAIE